MKSANQKTLQLELEQKRKEENHHFVKMGTSRNHIEKYKQYIREGEASYEKLLAIAQEDFDFHVCMYELTTKYIAAINNSLNEIKV